MPSGADARALRGVDGRSLRIEQHLHEGAAKARAIRHAAALAELRDAVGLRDFQPAGGRGQGETPKPKAALPVFKQYREADGRFYFKLVDGDGRLLLQSAGFASPREAGAVVAALKQGAAFALQDGALSLEGRQVAGLAEGVDEAALHGALAAFAD
jgi:tryptophanyl-tRNA synthetase